MKTAMATLGLLLLAGSARAACPNACSGHGSCGKFDMCSCFTNFEGGDCSQRVCPYSPAWVASANGDLNFDGDRFDGTQYNLDYPIAQNAQQGRLATQRSPGGGWEGWPFDAKTGEGHFYMECSNRGLCARDTGECACFAGYTGSACQRSECPSSCSGHGTCETIGEMVALAGKTYKFWDNDMQRTCLCDPGYAGIACEQRLCPVGDDPLTTDQMDSYMEIRIYADSAFSGTAALSFTDYYGEVWKTSAFVTDSTQSFADAASKMKVALEALPNSALTNIEVEADYCESVIPGNFKLTSDVWESSDTAGSLFVASDGDVIRCPDFSATTTPFLATTSSPYFSDLAGVAITGQTDDAELTCYLLQDGSDCIKYKVTFSSTPGDMALLQVDDSKVTVSGKNSFQDSSTNIGHSVTNTPEIGIYDSTHGTTVAFTKDLSKIGTANSGTVTASTKTVAMSAGASDFHPNERVEIFCGSDYSMGEFTISTVPSDTSFTVKETMVRDCAGDSGNEVKIYLRTPYFEFNADVTETLVQGMSVSSDSGSASSRYIVTELIYDGAAGKSYVQVETATAGSNYVVTTAGTHHVFIEGVGNKESRECADRGLCNRATGLCECFKGYAGDSCENQNALTV